MSRYEADLISENTPDVLARVEVNDVQESERHAPVILHLPTAALLKLHASGDEVEVTLNMTHGEARALGLRLLAGSRAAQGETATLAQQGRYVFFRDSRERDLGIRRTRHNGVEGCDSPTELSAAIQDRWAVAPDLADALARVVWEPGWWVNGYDRTRQAGLEVYSKPASWLTTPEVVTLPALLNPTPPQPDAPQVAPEWLTDTPEARDV